MCNYSPPSQGRNSLSLWFAYPDDLCLRETAETCALLLSDDERLRWQSFRFERDRRQYLATRFLVRTALSHDCGSEPRDLCFTSNPWGKPALYPDSGIRFNVSNCPALVVCLIAGETEVGVDAEPHERAPEIARLGPDVFSPAEQRQLEALPDWRKDARALTLWTLKESWVKARGMGLSLPLNEVSFLFSEDGADIRLEIEEPTCGESGRGWRFGLLDHAGHRIALMADCSEASLLERWELHPVLSTPVSLPGGREVWYPQIEGSRRQTENGSAPSAPDQS